MTEKEKIILEVINNYIKLYHTLPSRRFIQKKLNYKSVNSITQYFKSLEKKSYLDHLLKKYLPNANINIKKIKIINMKNKSIELALDYRKNYIAFRMNNDYFKEKCIIKNDILIIEKKKKLQNNDIGLFLIDDKYQIMEYSYKDGFYLLKDKETIILNKIKMEGKVIKVIRTI